MSEVDKCCKGLELVKNGIFILEDILYILNRIGSPLAAELEAAISDITEGSDMMYKSFNESINTSFSRAQQSSDNLLRLAMNLLDKEK